MSKKIEEMKKIEDYEDDQKRAEYFLLNHIYYEKFQMTDDDLNPTEPT